jgi:hypothetical protein
MHTTFSFLPQAREKRYCDSMMEINFCCSWVIHSTLGVGSSEGFALIVGIVGIEEEQ